MSTSPPATSSLLAFAAALLLLLPPSTADSSSPPTAYDALKAYNFPEGILPKGVTGYDLDPSTGRFSLYLNSSCSFSLEGSYQLRYQPVITGVVSPNRLSNLGGVSVKVLFLWLNIVEVVRAGDELEFSVGIASAGFAIENFYESPQCGCGFDCGTASQGERPRLRGGLASSM
ncbi:hypothetical protein MLD38_040027 [Melastoma candidum]|uniref:Uncharacterized protein n=1 Tax=Melastoma candidum TaxID=119954 RepID=A0ACB9L557_9MYRT|nr:hypothetical protein MLD38_040027 [Melastoma candidum]